MSSPTNTTAQRPGDGPDGRLTAALSEPITAPLSAP